MKNIGKVKIEVSGCIDETVILSDNQSIKYLTELKKDRNL